jgi:hypothetical protein
MPLSADDRDSVRSNIKDLGPHGALLFAAKELPRCLPTEHAKRRILVLTALEAARRLADDIQRIQRLARCHRQELKQAGVRI